MGEHFGEEEGEEEEKEDEEEEASWGHLGVPWGPLEGFFGAS